VPSSVTLLVSLFLILITFFVIINHAPSKDSKKKEVALKSMQNMFGKPEHNKINFGGMIKPKMDDYALEMEKLFGANAHIEATVNNDEISINASKNFFYFSDEVPFRPEKMDLLVKLQNILLRWDKSAHLKITFTLGASDYALDKKRLENFRRLMSRPGIDIGIDDNNKDKFSITIKYE
jgi:hypothetical protein